VLKLLGEYAFWWPIAISWLLVIGWQAAWAVQE